jgi:hypothetical protein
MTTKNEAIFSGKANGYHFLYIVAPDTDPSTVEYVFVTKEEFDDGKVEQWIQVGHQIIEGIRLD